MILFNENEIRQHVHVNQKTIAVIEEAFASLAANKVTMPPIMRVDIPENNGEVDVKTAYIRGLDKFCIKISAGFFNNPQLGLPSGNGMMLLVSTVTGVPQAVFLDNGYLTDVRTAAAGAVAAKYLARETVETVGVIGTGGQARHQLKALKQIRDFQRITIYGPTQSRAEIFAREMRETLGVETNLFTSPEAVVKESHVVITTTPAKTPIIKAEWLHPGLHITAMGSDAEHKQELEAGVFGQADVVACDVKSQCFRLGELHHALEQGTITKDHNIIELGELTSKQRAGRTNDQQITICDLTGTGVQDTAIALFAYDELVAQGLGLRIE
ncbi:cyclodeaminase [Fodinisporobacter ferrooxydans]|uniref:Cyclodeaminase n=1 Tax=Fodinisporobacter ferrooxydans TaxID=2901836 RepID=A0ABY4CKT3_9BACL|nr:cyclodeaminase [Alicyclobacillaceae bacterium MYW30-H2]